MNLKNSGCDVILGLRQGGESDKKAKNYGFKTMPIADAVKEADIIQILIPDEVQAQVYVKEIKPNEHRKAKDVLYKMLRSPGIALPMASTILRFLNPSAFQIIDDRVYRVVHPGKAKYPAKPQKLNERYLKTSSKIYFDYLDALHKLSSPKLPFDKADRILYQLDIKLGNKIGTGT